MSILVGLDVHRKQITVDWVDTVTGETQRGRVAPATRAAWRGWLGQFEGAGLRVAVEATTGWRLVVEELQAVGAEVHPAE